MRYVLAAFALLLLAVVSLAGFRGSLSRRPPIELFSDMVRQPKIRPQAGSEFFTNTQGSRLVVAGTIARETPFEDTPLYTGMVPGTTNFVDLNPLPLTTELLARGRERYQISCLPCHGGQGDGKGITSKLGMSIVGNLHDARIVKLADGELFQTVSFGKNNMQGYAANVAPADRWAIIAYLRVLQLSHLGATNDVPPDHRADLKK
jgi:mono/diheme cytochrome c family protein